MTDRTPIFTDDPPNLQVDQFIIVRTVR